MRPGSRKPVGLAASGTTSLSPSAQPARSNPPCGGVGATVDDPFGR
jgi:hypothetical protein